jgi:hypothetical protein
MLGGVAHLGEEPRLGDAAVAEATATNNSAAATPDSSFIASPTGLGVAMGGIRVGGRATKERDRPASGVDHACGVRAARRRRRAQVAPTIACARRRVVGGSHGGTSIPRSWNRFTGCTVAWNSSPNRLAAGQWLREQVVRDDNLGWSPYGAPWLQSVATARKSARPKSGSKTQKPLPWVATSCRRSSMVRRGSTVRVRQRALQKAAQNAAFSFRENLLLIERAIGMEPFMELSV